MHDREARHLRTVDAAREADDARVAERKRLGLLPIGPSLVLTPVQTDALRAGSLTLADFGIRVRLDWPAAEFADRLRKAKKRADRKRADHHHHRRRCKSSGGR